MRRCVIEDCISVIGRMWSWCVGYPKKDHALHASDIHEMTPFIKKHANKALQGHFLIKTKALVLARRWPSPVAYAGLHATNSARHLLGER